MIAQCYGDRSVDAFSLAVSGRFFRWTSFRKITVSGLQGNAESPTLSRCRIARISAQSPVYVVRRLSLQNANEDNTWNTCIKNYRTAR